MIRALSCPWVIAIGFGSPGRAAGEQDQAIAVVDIVGRRQRINRPGVQEVGRRKCLRRTGIQQSSGIRIASNANLGAPGAGKQTANLLRRQGRVHQGGRGADPWGTEHRRDRQQASDVDDRDAPACHPAGRQAGCASFDGVRQLAVGDRLSIDDERGAAGIACRRGVDDRADVHALPVSTEVTTMTSAAAGSSTGPAARARRASRSPGRDARAESQSGGA